jgi:host factor-I protein
MSKSINIQDTFLNHLRKDSVPVTVYLTNGFQIRGVVRAFDNFTIVIESEGRQQMIYKHAISTRSFRIRDRNPEIRRNFWARRIVN